MFSPRTALRSDQVPASRKNRAVSATKENIIVQIPDGCLASARIVNAIQSVTPSDIYAWSGPDVHLTGQSERTALEQKWFAVTGRVVAIKAETDGDLHIALADATGGKPGIVVCEIPPQPQWCEIRNTVFSWTRTRFPFHTSSAKKLNFSDSPVITVVGKAFFDIGHSLKDQMKNRRRNLPGYAAWEIHPVMKLTQSKDQKLWMALW